MRQGGFSESTLSRSESAPYLNNVLTAVTNAFTRTSISKSDGASHV